MKINRIFTLLSLCFIGLNGCLFLVKTSTKNKYYDIQKITISNCDSISDTQKIKRIVGEINSLSTGKWVRIHGKEGAHVIVIDLYGKNDKYSTVGLYDNTISRREKGHRHLHAVGVARRFDINKTPELKEIVHSCHY